jgi:hypothetical protein
MRFAIWIAAVALATTGALRGNTLSFTGDLRADVTFTACGTGCQLGPADSDFDYAQWAAVVIPFHLSAPAQVDVISFSYGGGVNGAGATIAQGGFEPYLSLFDGAGSFLASTFFGVTCPTGANPNSVSGQCYDVALVAGTLAAGDYLLALSAFENLSAAENFASGTLADGFTGLGGLAFNEDLHYALDVRLDDASTTTAPEFGTGPGPLVLMLFCAIRGSRRPKESRDFN